MFVFYYINQIKKQKLFLDELLTIILFVYFIFNMFINYLDSPSPRMLVENIPYLFRLQFLLFLLVFIRNRMELNDSLTHKVIYFNFIIFSSSLFIGYVFGFGLESYRFSGTSKGMFQGGNPVSILNLIFFSYFLLNGVFRKNIIPIALTVFNGFVIASKSVFGFIIPIYFALRRRALSVNKLIFYNIFILSIIFSFSYVTDRAADIYETRFGMNINKSIAAAEKIGGLYNNATINKIASVNFRRYASLNEQMEESFSNFNTFLLGKSFAGQKMFWEKRGEFFFRHASMDFFDFFFKFGIIGLSLFIIVFFLDYKIIFKNLFKRDGIVFGLFFLYAFFGGHVIDSVTSGSLFYFISGKISQNHSI